MAEHGTGGPGGAYRRALDSAAGGVCIVRREDGLLLYANRPVRAVWGDTAAPRYCYELLLGRETPCEDCRRSRLTEREELVQSLQPADGRHYEVRSCAMDWDGVPACALYLTDVTREVEAERRSRRRYQEEENRRRLQERDILVVAVMNMTRGTLVSSEFSLVRPEDLKLYPGQPLDYLLEEVPLRRDRDAAEPDRAAGGRLVPPDDSGGGYRHRHERRLPGEGL